MLKNIETVCTSAPPEIQNGQYSGSSNPVTGSVYKYECNNNYFAHSNYSSNAIATCTSFGNYSVGTEDLITCTQKGYLSNLDEYLEKLPQKIFIMCNNFSNNLHVFNKIKC